jgi:hypothetical protein
MNNCDGYGAITGEGNDNPVIKSNISAIVSLIFGNMGLMGLVSLQYIMYLIGASSNSVISSRADWAMDILVVLVPVFGILAIAFGIAGMKQTASDSSRGGRKMAKAGLVTGIIIALLGICFLILVALYD